MTRTPDEIKKGLEMAAIDCRDAHDCEKTCAYHKACSGFYHDMTSIPCVMVEDALTLIQQLQAELEDMTARYKIADDCAKKKGEMNEKLYAELTAVKAERDDLRSRMEETSRTIAEYMVMRFPPKGGWA